MPNMNVARFLSLIIPEGGRYVGFYKDGARGRNVSATSVKALVAALMQYNEQGNVYFAPASYGEGSGRKKTDVIGVRSLWADLDAHGDGKGYDTVEEARAAAYSGCDALGLPAPLMVDTGRGVQPWFVFSRRLELAQWQRLALAFKKGLQAVGVRIDPTRTADIASIMRLPGSVNHAVGVEATIGADHGGAGSFDPDEFERILAPYVSASPQQAPSLHLATDNGKAVRKTPTRFHRHNKDANLIVGQCAQLAHFKETGSETEPHWKASASILATCMDGEELFHAWSSNYNEYDRDEAQAKIAAALEADAPNGCASFAECNSLCEGCSYFGKIKGPAVLGELSAHIAAPIRTEDGEEISFADWTLPPGYYLNKKRQLVVREGQPDGDPLEILVCDRPVRLLNLAEHEEDKTHYVNMQQYSAADEALTTRVMAVEDLVGPAGLTHVQKFGPVVFEGEKMRRYLQFCRSELNRPGEMKELYSSYGWKKSGFLLGPTLYTKDGPRPALLQAGSFADQKARTLSPGGGERRGSLEGWKRAVQFCLQPGCEFQADALFMSFASPLMHLIPGAEGGAVRHYCSPKTGGGKTAASMLGQSVWGATTALRIEVGTSEAARRILWSGAGSLPTFEDESARQDAVQIKNRIMAFASGKDKDTANSKRQIVSPTATRSSIYIVTSNESMLAALSQGEGSDAMAARVFETQVQPLQVRVNPRLLAQLAENVGWAGPEYIDYVARHTPAIVQVLSTVLALYEEKYPDVGMRYKRQILTTSAVARTLVIKLGLLDDFDQSRLQAWQEAELANDLQYSGVVREEDVLRLFLDDARDKTLSVSHDMKDGKQFVSVTAGTFAPKKEIAVRMEVSRTRCQISRRSLAAFLSQHSITPKDFYRWAVKEGLTTEKDVSTARDLTNGIATCRKGVELVMIVDMTKLLGKLDDI